MLHSKDIKNLSELKSTFAAITKKADFFFDFVDVLKIGKFHGLFYHAKQKGIAPLLLIRLLLSFPFINQQSVHSFSKSLWNRLKIGKDAFYRLKNNPKINWRKFLLTTAKLSAEAIDNAEDKGDNPQSKTTAFIFDDSPLEKSGYKIEGVSTIWNHVIQRHVLGFQLLVMGYFNGTTLLPTNFSLHREKGSNKKKPFGLKPSRYKKQYTKQRENNSHGAKRKKELDI